MCSKERGQLSLPSDHVRKTSHKLLPEHDSSNHPHKPIPATLHEHRVCEEGWEQGRKVLHRAGDFEQLPDGTGTVCFIYLMKKEDLSLQPFIKGFFLLSWKCLTLPGSFLTVTHEIKIFINCRGIARTSLLSVLLKQEASDDWKSWQPVQADMKNNLLSSVIQIRKKDQVQLRGKCVT